MWILPHSLITVSLATAMLPSASRLAAAGDLTGVAAEATRTMRLALSVLVPTSVAFVVLGLPIARLVFGFGAGAEDWQFTGYALMALGIGLVPFTLQYVCLRAFYALENTRTPFLIQIVIAGANVVIGVGVVVALDSAPLVAAGLGAGLLAWRTCSASGSPSVGCSRPCPPWPCDRPRPDRPHPDRRGPGRPRGLADPAHPRRRQPAACGRSPWPWPGWSPSPVRRGGPAAAGSAR